MQFDEFILSDSESYLIQRDTINNNARRSFKSKDLNKKTDVGVYLVDLNSYSLDRKDYTKKLFFHTKNYSEANESEIRQILESIRIDRKRSLLRRVETIGARRSTARG